MKTKKQSQELATIPTPKKEPLLSSEDLIHFNLAAPEVKPSAADVLKAIDVLAACAVAETSIAEGGNVGDVFLYYNITVCTKGKRPFTIKDRRTIHGVLTRTGVPDAPEAINLALLDITRPVRDAAKSWIDEYVMGMKIEKPNDTPVYGR